MAGLFWAVDYPGFNRNVTAFHPTILKAPTVLVGFVSQLTACKKRRAFSDAKKIPNNKRHQESEITIFKAKRQKTGKFYMDEWSNVIGTWCVCWLWSSWCGHWLSQGVETPWLSVASGIHETVLWISGCIDFKLLHVARRVQRSSSVARWTDAAATSHKLPSRSQWQSVDRLCGLCLHQIQSSMGQLKLVVPTDNAKGHPSPCWKWNMYHPLFMSWLAIHMWSILWIKHQDIWNWYLSQWGTVRQILGPVAMGSRLGSQLWKWGILLFHVVAYYEIIFYEGALSAVCHFFLLRMSPRHAVENVYHLMDVWKKIISWQNLYINQWRNSLQWLDSRYCCPGDCGIIWPHFWRACRKKCTPVVSINCTDVLFTYSYRSPIYKTVFVKKFLFLLINFQIWSFNVQKTLVSFSRPCFPLHFIETPLPAHRVAPCVCVEALVWLPGWHMVRCCCTWTQHDLLSCFWKFKSEPLNVSGEQLHIEEGSYKNVPLKNRPLPFWPCCLSFDSRLSWFKQSHELMDLLPPAQNRTQVLYSSLWALPWSSKPGHGCTATVSSYKTFTTFNTLECLAG